MCSLFGIIDYKNSLPVFARKSILRILSQECEVRGTDATDIAYISDSGLHVYKRPVSASKFRFSLPHESKMIIGHTRMTTKGSNPLAIYDCGGYYVYASTADILDRALKRLRIRKKSSIEIHSGEILKISADGAIERSTFNNDEYDYPKYTYGRCFDDPYSDYTSEIDEIISFAAYFGFDESDIIMLLDLGYDAFEIEEMLYDPLSMRSIISEYRDMITCEYGG